MKTISFEYNTQLNTPTSNTKKSSPIAVSLIRTVATNALSISSKKTNAFYWFTTTKITEGEARGFFYYSGTKYEFAANETSFKAFRNDDLLFSFANVAIAG